MATRAIEEGNLTKLGYKSGKWQKRWFELRCEEQCDPELLYFSNKGQTTERGCIALDSFTECRLADVESCPSADALAPGVVVRKGIPEHCLQVTAPWDGSSRRTFYLAADSSDSVLSWKASIQQSVKLVTDDDGEGAHTGAGTAMVGLAAAMRGQQIQDEELTEANQSYSPIDSEDDDGFVDLGSANGIRLEEGGGGDGANGDAACGAHANAEQGGGSSVVGEVAPAIMLTTTSPARYTPIPRSTQSRASGVGLAASWDSAGEPTIGDRLVDMIATEFGLSQTGRRRPASPPITDPF